MLHNLSIQRLRTFVTVAELENMTRAARVLHQTQGAISQQIKKLEDELEQPLVLRGNTRISLTDAGALLLQKAKQLLALNDAILADLAGDACAGAVSLGLPIDLANSELVAQLLRSFAEQFPQVAITLQYSPTEVLKTGLRAGKLDLAVLQEFPEQQMGKTLFKEQLYWIGAINGQAVSRKPLPLSLASTVCVFKPLAHAELNSAGIEWESKFENDNFQATLSIIRMDLAIGMSIASAVPDNVTTLTQAYLPKLPRINITLAKTNALSRAGNALHDHLLAGLDRL